MRIRTLCLTLAVAVAAGAFACREEGSAEKAGRKLDQAVDSVRQGGEDAIEKLGRKTDDAIGEAKDAVGGATDDAKDAAEDEKDSETGAD